MPRIQTLLIHRPFSGESGLACSREFFIHFFWTKKTSDTVFFISGSSSCHPPIDQASGEGDNSNCNGGDSMSTFLSSYGRTQPRRNFILQDGLG